MNRHDLNLAFYRRLIALTYANMVTVRPDEVFDPKEEGGSSPLRLGRVVGPAPETAGFGNGVYTRLYGIYQIDLWIPRDTQNAFKLASQYSDDHVTQFWPANARGLTVTENATSAHIVVRPRQTAWGRAGAYLHEMIEVEFYVEEFPS